MSSLTTTIARILLTNNGYSTSSSSSHRRRDEIDYSCRAKQFHLQITLPNHPKDGEIDVSQHTHVLKTKPWYQEGAQDYAAFDGMGGGRRIQPRRPTGRGAVVVSHQFGISPTLFGINPKKEKLDCFGKCSIDFFETLRLWCSGR